MRRSFVVETAVFTYTVVLRVSIPLNVSSNLSSDWTLVRFGEERVRVFVRHREFTVRGTTRLLYDYSKVILLPLMTFKVVAPSVAGFLGGNILCPEHVVFVL